MRPAHPARDFGTPHQFRDPEILTTTGNFSVFTVRGHLTFHGHQGAVKAREIGCLDAPSHLAAGSVRSVTDPSIGWINRPLQTCAWRD